MNWFYTITATTTAIAVVVLWRMLPPLRGGRSNGLIVAMILATFCSALLTPAARDLIDGYRSNTAHMLVNVLALGVAAALVQWVRTITAAEAGPLPGPRRDVSRVINAAYAAAAVALVVFFFRSPEKPDGVGIYRDFAGNPWMQAYWVVFAVAFAAGLTIAGVLFARAAGQESGLRRVCTALIVAGCFLGVLYMAWKMVLVTVFAAATPQWAQTTSSLLIAAFVGAITIGVLVPPIAGAVVTNRVAAQRIRELAPLHGWLMEQYPQLRYRRTWRPAARATDMLVEISDALPLLQREQPELAARHGLDRPALDAATGSAAPGAYEHAAARAFAAATAR